MKRKAPREDEAGASGVDAEGDREGEPIMEEVDASGWRYSSEAPDIVVFREQEDSYISEQCSLTKEVGLWQTIGEDTGSISAMLGSELPTIKRYRLFERANVGRQEIISSLNTTLGIKKSCYIVCRDLETYGEVAAFCEVEIGLSDY